MQCIKNCGYVIGGLMAIMLSSQVVGAQDRDCAPEVRILQQTSKAFADVARGAMPAVVFIRVEKTLVQPGSSGQFDPNDLLEHFFGLRRRPRERLPERRFRQQGQGTGFLVSEDGYILTNNHIVGDADRITVTTDDGREFKAELIGSDPGSEVAVIKIEGSGFPVLPVGDSDEIEIGEWVIAIGNPFGLSKTLTVGVVSAKGRNNIGITDYEDFIQTDAAINPGNSGGPLLNVDGKVIGINTAIFSQMGGSLGIGFAIPINMAMHIREQLMEKGQVARGFLGVVIQDMSAELAASFNFPEARGVLISEVLEDGPAAQGGLRVGDIIMDVDGRAVGGAAAFRNLVAMTSPGTHLKMNLWREGARKTLEIKVGAPEGAPVVPPRTGLPVPAELGEKLGFNVENLTPQWGQRFGYEPGAGVLVTRVRPESPASAAGLRPGQLIVSVNHIDVASVDEFNQAVRQSTATGMLLLLVRDNHGSRFIVLSLP